MSVTLDDILERAKQFEARCDFGFALPALAAGIGEVAEVAAGAAGAASSVASSAVSAASSVASGVQHTIEGVVSNAERHDDADATDNGTAGILFAAARPGGHAALLLRCPATTTTEDTHDTWRLPRIGEFSHQGEIEPWIEGTSLAEVDSEFTPPGVPARNAQWIAVDLAASCLPQNFEPGVLPALQRFVREHSLDRILAHADAATTQKGDSMEPRSVFIDIQSRAQRAYGDATPAQLNGESSHDYECRLMKPHQPRSKQYRDTNLDAVRDPIVRAMLADSIYQDSASYCPPGTMRPVRTRDPAGREITRYEGDIAAFMDQFNPPLRYVRRLLTQGARA